MSNFADDDADERDGAPNEQITPSVSGEMSSWYVWKVMMEPADDVLAFYLPRCTLWHQAGSRFLLRIARNMLSRPA